MFFSNFTSGRLTAKGWVVPSNGKIVPLSDFWSPKYLNRYCLDASKLVGVHSRSTSLVPSTTFVRLQCILELKKKKKKVYDKIVVDNLRPETTDSIYFVLKSASVATVVHFPSSAFISTTKNVSSSLKLFLGLAPTWITTKQLISKY